MKSKFYNLLFNKGFLCDSMFIVVRFDSFFNEIN